MGKNNYYAVRKGKNPGIYEKWEECQNSTKGFSGAEFSSFSTLQEAEAYINGSDIYIDTIKADIDKGYIVAYCDGSFDDKQKRYSYGVIIIDSDLKETEICGSSSNERYISSNNIIGEVVAIFKALDWVVSNGYGNIKIYHDYEGLSKWITGEWQAKSEVAKMYVSVIKEKYGDILNIEFEKVKGHSNNKYNDMVDQLAKEALKDRKSLAVKGDNWFTMPYFKEIELKNIISKISEEYTQIIVENTEDTNKIIYKLKMGKNKLAVTLFSSGNKRLMVQGVDSLLFQIFMTYITELLGIDKIEGLFKEIYRKTIDKDKVADSFNDMCSNLTVQYPDNIKKLIKQSIINIYYCVEGEDYGHYTFPALKALEGHIKYILDKNGIIVSKTLNFFDYDKNTQIYTLKSNVNITDQVTIQKLEKYYNYYNLTRHSIFHFGDIIGNTDTTRMIDTKEEANDIIKECLKFINE